MADEIKVPIVSTYDDKEAKDAIKDAEKIEDLKPEVEITADASDADAKMESVSSDVKALSAEDAKVVVTAKIDAAKADLRALQDQLEALEKPVDIDTQPATGSIKNVGAQADQSKNALANMVGNSAQDLGALSGVAGSAGTALGQLAEFAADGNLSLAGLAKVAGPMAALGIVTAVVSDHLQDIAKTKAWNKKEVDDYVEAIRDGESALAHLKSEITKTGKIEFIDDGDVKDATEAVDDLGLSVKDFNEFVRDSSALTTYTSQFDSLRTAAEAYSAETAQGVTHTKEQSAANAEMLAILKDVDSLTTAVTQKRQNLTDAEEKAERINRLLGIATAETERETRRLAGAADTAATSIGKIGPSSKTAAEKTDEAFQKIETAANDSKDAIDKMRGAINFESESAQMQTDLLNALNGIKNTGIGPTQEQITQLKLDYIDLAETAGKTPIEIATGLRQIEGGDYMTVLANVQAMSKLNPILLETALKTPAPRPRSGGGNIRLGPDGEVISGTSFTPPPTAAAMTVNVNMPTGSRGVDVVRQVSGQARRSGRRYGTPVVHYTRR